MGRVALHAAILAAVGGLAFMLALLLLAPQIQPCFPGVGAPAARWCDPFRPAWLASLSPVERFLVDNRDVLPVLWAGLAAAAVLGVELVWRFVRSRRESIGY